jgi:hypothetical protein
LAFRAPSLLPGFSRRSTSAGAAKREPAWSDAARERYIYTRLTAENMLSDVVLKDTNSIDRNPYYVSMLQCEVVSGDNSRTGH